MRDIRQFSEFDNKIHDKMIFIIIFNSYIIAI